MTDEQLQAILTAIQELTDATLEPAGLTGEAVPAWISRLVEVEGTTTDDIVQGPSIVVPKGFKVSVRMRHHTTSAGRLGYVSYSKDTVQQDGNRKVIKSNDSFVMAVSNFNKFWFWTDTATAAAPTQFELTVETNPS